MPFPKTTGDLVSAADWNSLIALDVAEVTSGTAASLTLTVPSGVGLVRVAGRGRADGSGNTLSLQMQLNGVTASQYREQRIVWTGTTTTPAMASEVRSDFVAGLITGAGVGGTVFGITDILLEGSGTETISFNSHSGVVPGGTVADARTRLAQGHTTFAGPIASILLFPSAGSFTAGTRYRLLLA